MQCPKCGVEQPDGRILCDRCGIVFAKYYKYHPRREEETRDGKPVHLAETAAHRPPPLASVATGPRDSLLRPPAPQGGWLSFSGRSLIGAILLVWGFTLMLTPVDGNAAGQSVLHLVNLPFHEFGHLLFRPFGQWIGSLGGTLGQLLMPAICTAVLLLQTRDPFGAAVALWWFGENFLDIAPYINDARAGVLPLLGGNTGQTSPYGFHDWEYLLGETGLLHLDHRLAQASHGVGALVMVLALVWAAWLLLRQYRSLSTRDA